METIQNTATYPGGATLVVVQGKPPSGAGFESAAPRGLDVVFEQSVGVPAAFGLGNGIVLAVAIAKPHFNCWGGNLGSLPAHQLDCQLDWLRYRVNSAIKATPPLPE